MSESRPHRRDRAITGERDMLESFLDDYRDILVRKVSGLSDADAGRRLVTSATTVGGLVKHLRWVDTGGSTSCCRNGSTTTVAPTIGPESSNYCPKTSWPRLLLNTRSNARGPGGLPRGTRWITRCRTSGSAGCPCAGSICT